MKIKIRREMKKDHRAVEELTREAFWNLYIPGCNEHYLVHTMRSHKDFVHDMDFVAEYKGKIVGIIMYTKSWLVNENGRKLTIVSFGPLCVLPKYQRKGIGTELINHTLKIASKRKIKAIVIFGDPHNYCKHGFRNAKDLNISTLDGKYPYGMLALALKKGGLKRHTWKYRYSDVYTIDEKEVEKYDKTLTYKEKKYHYSQEIFSISIRSYLENKKAV